MTIPEVIRSVFDSFSAGDNRAPEEFARELKSFGGYDHIVMTGSGRAGFRLLLESLNLPPGSEIIFPAYTFHIMPVVAAECGLKPIFADVDPDSWNIDPEKISPLINKNTRVIMPTHLFGVPADMEKIGEIARNNGLLLFEDCAHALGALDGEEPVGNKGDAALFTFAMSKNMPCWGGGAIVVRDQDLAERMLSRIDARGVPSARSILRRQISNIPGIILTLRGIFSWTLYPAIRLADLKESNYFDRPFIEEVRGSGTGNQLSVISDQYGPGLDRESRIIDSSAARKNMITGISPFQTSVGLRQLKRFPGWLRRQVKNARHLRDLRIPQFLHEEQVQHEPVLRRQGRQPPLEDRLAFRPHHPRLGTVMIRRFPFLGGQGLHLIAAGRLAHVIHVMGQAYHKFLSPLPEGNFMLGRSPVRWRD